MIFGTNIIMTYPVMWTIWSVMRDFIQNFYDSIGAENFGSGFHYNYSENVLTMQALAFNHNSRSEEMTIEGIELWRRVISAYPEHEVSEIKFFMEKYPRLSQEDLIKRIINESEILFSGRLW